MFDVQAISSVINAGAIDLLLCCLGGSCGLLPRSLVVCRSMFYCLVRGVCEDSWLAPGWSLGSMFYCLGGLRGLSPRSLLVFGATVLLSGAHSGLWASFPHTLGFS